MKTIYFITIPELIGIGGAQLYAIRRAKYLIKKGYSVFFLVIQADNIHLEWDIEIRIIKNRWLNTPIFMINNNQIAAEISKISAVIDQELDLKNVIFETFSWEAATWAETFAKQFNAKHFVYSLGEPPLDNLRHKFIHEFFMHKYKQHELLGLSDMSLSIILGKKFDTNYNPYVNISFELKEIVNITQPRFLETIDRNRFTITTVSRLEKSYVVDLIENIIVFAKRNFFNEFNLIICGDGVIKGKTSNDFILHYQNLIPKNLKIYFPGYTFPLGKDLFEVTNVFVGMGTSAVSSISQKCPTICVDPRNGKSIGVFGVDTFNFAYPKNDNSYENIEDTVARLYHSRDLMNRASQLGFELFMSNYEYNACMKKVDLFIDKIKNSNYFDFWNLTFRKKVLLIIEKITFVFTKNRLLVLIYKLVVR